MSRIPSPILHEALAKAVDKIPVGVTVSDPSGQIVYTNSAEAAMHGWAVDELIGKPVKVFNPPWASDRRGPGTLDQVRDWTRERVNLRKDGSSFPVLLRSCVLIHDEGEPLGVVTVSEDRSGVSSSSGSERPAAARAGLTLAGEWALGVAHDFNNILTVVGGVVELMLDTEDRRERVDIGRLALDQVDRGRRLVRWLQDVSQNREPQFESIKLATVVNEFADTLNRLLPDDVLLRIHHEGKLPLVVGDPVLVQEALLNLVTNARDAMPDGGSITVTTWTQQLDGPSQVLISVADTGTGIRASDQPHLFDPFYTTKERGKGTGLGLAFVNSIMERLGGTVQLESILGRGTRVILTFPTAKPRA